MNSRVPECLHPLLSDYLTLVEQALPGLVSGFYLHGSLALDAFDPAQSDVDFVAVLSRPWAAPDMDHLTAIHRQIAQSYPRWPMQGSYLLASDLGQPHSPPAPGYGDGRLTSRPDAENPVTWWLLKQRGIGLLGPAPDELDYPLDRAALNAWLLGNMNRYWGGFTRQPRRVAWLMFDYGIHWTVLGVLRQVYTLREGLFTSKLGAGAYGLDVLAPRWRRLLSEAVALRRQTGARTLYRSRLGRALEARQFLATLIRTCNRDAVGAEKVFV